MLLTNKEAVQLPRIKPLALRTRQAPFDDPHYQFELKYDGYRGVGYFEQDRCRFVSRNDKILAQFQQLCEAIASELKVENAIFDGEIIAYDATGRPIFNNMRRRKGPFQYVAFDLLWLNNQDLRNLPLEQRRQLLLEILPKKSSLMVESVASIGNGIKMFQYMVDYDLEGVVAKRLDGKYLRTTKWYKIKNKSYSQALGRGRFF
ncbi:MAG: hypothetical protein KF799_09490 [Bdellovibrionales bacterium]|nr:hypothetical protein [Bdellovibrionales bacterium]